MSMVTRPMIVAALMPFADEADLNISESEDDTDAYRARHGSLKVKDFRLARTVCDAVAASIGEPDPIIDALRECEDYFDNRADADCDQDGYIPNEEMKLLQVVREALKKAGA